MYNNHNLCNCYSLKRLNVDELYNVFSFLHMVVFKGGKTRIFSDYHYIEFKSYLLKLKVHPSLNQLPETNLSKDDTCTEDHAKNFLVLVTMAILHGFQTHPIHFSMGTM